MAENDYWAADTDGVIKWKVVADVDNEPTKTKEVTVAIYVNDGVEPVATDDYLHVRITNDPSDDNIAPPQPITLPTDLGNLTIQENQTGTIAQLAALPQGWAYELISGPTGVTLSANGTLSTNVPFDYEGFTQHEVKIRALNPTASIQSTNDVDELIDVTNEVEITHETTGYYDNTENPSSPFQCLSISHG